MKIYFFVIFENFWIFGTEVPKWRSGATPSRGVVTVALVPRPTYIGQTPGNHHLSTESNRISAKGFSHCQSIWLKNMHNLIRYMKNKSRIKKWKALSCKGKNLLFSRTKNFFSNVFFQIFLLIHVNTLWALNVIYE